MQAKTVWIISLEVESEAIVKALNPDYELLKRLDARGVIGNEHFKRRRN